MSSTTPTAIESCARVLRLQPGLVAFYGRNSWYKLPAELTPIFRRAKRTGRVVTFTTDRDCNILTADIA